MIVVECLDPRFKSYIPRAKKITSWLLKRFDKRRFHVEIVLVGNKTMKKNVISYPAKSSFPRPDLPAQARLRGQAGIKQKSLGEIYLNPILIKRQGWLFEYMLIHGFLHLLGYDHMKKSDRMSMERLEQKLLTELRF